MSARRWFELPDLCGLRLNALLAELGTALGCAAPTGAFAVHGFVFDGRGWVPGVAGASDRPAVPIYPALYGPEPRGEDCGCRTHVGTHAIHMDALWRERNRAAVAAAMAAPDTDTRAWLGVLGAVHEEQARLTEKAAAMRQASARP